MAAPKTPLLTVDIIIELIERDDARPIVLIERRFPPLGWAFPGGFVDVGEACEDAAVREALEETSLHVELVALLGCYSAPTRDHRGHSASLVYVATARGEPQAADDAQSIAVVNPALPGKLLMFDHELILADYLAYRQTGRVAPLRRSSAASAQNGG